jgi:N-methylhydantoinase B
MAFTVHKAPEHKIDGVAYGVAGLINGGQGIFGGYPAAPSILDLLQGTSLSEHLAANTTPGELSELGGTHTILQYANFEIRENDVLYYTLGMGGGYGSPLHRNPQAVRKDVENELVSLEAAFEVYGVVIDPDTLELDLAATLSTRRARQREHLQRKS